MATAKCGNEHKWFTNTTSKWCISGENISAIWPCKKHKSSSSRYSYIIKAAISFLAVIIITIICRKINLYSKPLSHFKQSICTVPSKIYFVELSQLTLFLSRSLLWCCSPALLLGVELSAPRCVWCHRCPSLGSTNYWGRTSLVQAA